MKKLVLALAILCAGCGAKQFHPDMLCMPVKVDNVVMLGCADIRQIPYHEMRPYVPAPPPMFPAPNNDPDKDKT